MSNRNNNGKENKKRTYWSIESLRDLRSSELKECEYCPYLHQVEKKTCAILGLFMLPILLLANRMWWKFSGSWWWGEPRQQLMSYAKGFIVDLMHQGDQKLTLVLCNPDLILSISFTCQIPPPTSDQWYGHIPEANLSVGLRGKMRASCTLKEKVPIDALYVGVSEWKKTVL